MHKDGIGKLKTDAAQYHGISSRYAPSSALIGGFAADGDLQKIKNYLASTEAAIEALTPVRYCENETVNLILSSFQNKAQKNKVSLQINVKLPGKLDINDTEL